MTRPNLVWIAESQPMQWRMRLTSWLLDRLADPEKETALDMLSAGLSEAHSEGLDDGAQVVERILAATSGDANRALTIAAKALRDLAALNRKHDLEQTTKNPPAEADGFADRG